MNAGKREMQAPYMVGSFKGMPYAEVITGMGLNEEDFLIRDISQKGERGAEITSILIAICPGGLENFAIDWIRLQEINSFIKIQIQEVFYLQKIALKRCLLYKQIATNPLSDGSNPDCKVYLINF